MIDEEKSDSYTGDLISAYIVVSENRIEITQYDINDKMIEKIRQIISGE